MHCAICQGENPDTMYAGSLVHTKCIPTSVNAGEIAELLREAKVAGAIPSVTEYTE